MGLTPSRLSDEDFPSQEGKIVVVTGSNTGLGLASAKEFARKGARVIMACRSEERALPAIKQVQEYAPGSTVEFLRLDLGDLESVKQFAKDLAVRCPHVDVLMNNAGIMIPPYGKTKQGFEQQMGVNHFGHYALTLQVLPLLRKAPSGNPRVVVLSSLAAARPGVQIFWNDVNWENTEYDKRLSYGQSKLANLLFALELEKRLAATKKEGDAQVDVMSAHPGWTKTDLARHHSVVQVLVSVLGMSAASGCLSQLYAAVSPNAKSGDYYGPSWGPWGPPAEAKVPRAGRDEEAATKLWELSAACTGAKL
eukprot:TRINITY_DN11226_c0_g2_i1.p1 TRINITY_DN11226_c0_g2~~TRINITY_DN11226_c0_g2_i1.p1  ORF type:complete len:327 (+),score=127.47 TRINITY_DN11226_c0_g2_i1:58-981(+)